MLHKSSLEQRLERLLDRQQDRQQTSRRTLLAMLVTATLLCGLFATLKPTVRAAETTERLIVMPSLDALSPEMKAQWQAEGATTDDQIRMKLLDLSEKIIRQRLENAAIPDVHVEKQQDGKLCVVIEDETHRAQVKDLVTRPGTLGFFQVADYEETAAVFSRIEQDPKFQGRWTSLFSVSKQLRGVLTFAPENRERIASIIEEIDKTPKLLPENRRILLATDSEVMAVYLIHTGSPLSRVAVTAAGARLDPSDPNRATVFISLSEADGQRMGDFSKSCINKRLGIVVDGILRSAPTVRDRITKNAQITGNFTMEEAENIAASLMAGSLPAPLVEVE